jgi:predicted DNA-binding transcriptional regulator AlpA
MAPATLDALDARSTTVPPEDAARRLGIEESTLANWRWNGRGPRYVRVGRRVRYRLADLAEWLDQQTRRSTSDAGRPDA